MNAEQYKKLVERANKKPAKSDKQKLKAKLDKMCSEFVRKRAIKESGGCQRCGAQKHDIIKDDGSIYPAYKQLQWAHCFTRSVLATRWDERNGLGLCAGCHFYLDARGDEKQSFFLSMLGQQQFDLLSAGFHYAHSKTDMAGMELYLEKLLETV